MNSRLDHIRVVADLLNEQAGLFDEIHQQLERQHSALAASDTGSLRCHTEELERIHRLMSGVDGRRRRHLEALGSGEGIPAERMTLGSLVELAGPALGRKLSAAGNRLKEGLRRVESLRPEVESLLEKNIEFSRRGFTWLREAGRGGETYDKSARIRQSETDSRIIDRTA